MPRKSLPSRSAVHIEVSYTGVPWICGGGCMSRNWYFGWNIVALTMVMQAVSIGILIYSFALFVVPWLDEFSVPRRDIMICVATLQLMTGFFSPFVGRILDRFPARSLVLTGVTVLATGLMLLSFTNALWQLLLLHATLLPIGMAMTGPLTAQILVTRWFQERRGRAIGISALGTSLGGFCFPLLNSQLIQIAGWRTTYLLLALLALLLIVPPAWLLLAREPESSKPSEQTKMLPEYRLWSTREIFTSPMFWITVVAFVPNQRCLRRCAIQSWCI